MTSRSPLERLAGPGNVLANEAPDAKEFDGFDLAYGAAHALCLAALRHHGYRPSQRYIVFQVLLEHGCCQRARLDQPFQQGGDRQCIHDQGCRRTNIVRNGITGMLR